MTSTIKLALASLAIAGMLTPLSTLAQQQRAPEWQSPMARAIAKGEESPEALRRFVERTRMIYSLDYYEVMREVLARKEAAARASAIATAPAPAKEAPARRP
jgi:hypothetical protein